MGMAQKHGDLFPGSNTRQDVASIELEDESQHTQLFVPEQPPRVRPAVGSPELLPAAWPEAVEDEDEGSEDQEEDQEDQDGQDAEKAEGEDADETEEVEEIEEVEGEEGEEGEEEECTEEQPWQLILFRGYPEPLKPMVGQLGKFLGPKTIQSLKR